MPTIVVHAVLNAVLTASTCTYRSQARWRCRDMTAVWCWTRGETYVERGGVTTWRAPVIPLTAQEPARSVYRWSFPAKFQMDERTRGFDFAIPDAALEDGRGMSQPSLDRQLKSARLSLGNFGEEQEREDSGGREWGGGPCVSHEISCPNGCRYYIAGEEELS